MSGGFVSPTAAFGSWEITSSVDCLRGCIALLEVSLSTRMFRKAKLHHQGQNNLLWPRNPFRVCSCLGRDIENISLLEVAYLFFKEQFWGCF